uniref:Protein kinase domain-containing protein n=1 Tax=Oryza nivara TaxID=4536 RepID=A0A0E0FXT7_ORYNI
MRIETLLGVLWAIEYLQFYNERPVIHCDINSSSILFDATWAPRLADFGASVRCDPSSRSVRPDAIYGKFGYIDLEHDSDREADDRRVQLRRRDAGAVDGDEGTLLQRGRRARGVRLLGGGSERYPRRLG